MNWAAHSISVSCRLMLPVSRFAPNGNARIAKMTAVVSGRRRYAQWIVQSSSRIVAAAPDEPGDVPRQDRPRREERQHPRRVDVGQERAGRVVRVAAVEPDPDAGPVRPRIGAGRLAAGDHAGHAASENVRLSSTIAAMPARVAQARRLAAERPAEDAGATARRAVDHVGEVRRRSGRDPAPIPGPGGGSGWLVRVGHRAGFSHAGDRAASALRAAGRVRGGILTAIQRRSP